MTINVADIIIIIVNVALIFQYFFSQQNVDYKNKGLMKMNEVVFWIIAFCLFLLVLVIAVSLYGEYKEFRSTKKRVEKLQKEVSELIDKIH